MGPLLRLTGSLIGLAFASHRKLGVVGCVRRQVRMCAGIVAPNPARGSGPRSTARDAAAATPPAAELLGPPRKLGKERLPDITCRMPAVLDGSFFPILPCFPIVAADARHGGWQGLTAGAGFGS